MLARTKENILADFQSLMGKFDEKIGELAQYSRENGATPDKAETNELNVLKLERMRVKQYWEEINIMTEEQVLEVRDQYEEGYRIATDTLSQPSKSMS